MTGVPGQLGGDMSQVRRFYLLKHTHHNYWEWMKAGHVVIAAKSTVIDGTLIVFLPTFTAS